MLLWFEFPHCHRNKLWVWQSNIAIFRQFFFQNRLRQSCWLTSEVIIKFHMPPFYSNVVLSFWFFRIADCNTFNVKDLIPLKAVLGCRERGCTSCYLYLFSLLSRYHFSFSEYYYNAKRGKYLVVILFWMQIWLEV
jgi:hypothetical protein